MNDFEEKNNGMEPEVEFPEKTGAEIPGGDATSDVFSADSINRNASAGSVPGGDPYGSTERPEDAQRPPQQADPYGGAPRTESGQPQQGARPDTYPYRERPYYPYGGTQNASGARQQAPGGQPNGDYYRNVYSNAGDPQNNPYPYLNRQNQYAYPDEPPKKKGRAGKVVLGILIGALVLCVVCGFLFGIKGLFSRQQTTHEPETEAIDNLDRSPSQTRGRSRRA